MELTNSSKLSIGILILFIIFMFGSQYFTYIENKDFCKKKGFADTPFLDSRLDKNVVCTNFETFCRTSESGIDYCTQSRAWKLFSKEKEHDLNAN